MSHKFHGKGSGKKKMERRMKKVKDEQVGEAFSYQLLGAMSVSSMACCESCGGRYAVALASSRLLDLDLWL